VADDRVGSGLNKFVVLLDLHDDPGPIAAQDHASPDRKRNPGEVDRYSGPTQDRVLWRETNIRSKDPWIEQTDEGQHQQSADESEYLELAQE